MAAPVRFYFDFLSPYSYLAIAQAETICETAGRLLEPVCVDLVRLKTAAGNTGPSTREIPPKARYARVDLARWARRYGIPLTPPEKNNSVRVNRGFYMTPLGERRAYMHAVWKRTWGEGCDSMQDALLGEVAAAMNWEPTRFIRQADSDEAAQALGAATEAAIREGIFGVPMCLVDGQMWWGNDRLFFVEEYLKSAPYPS